jgi:uncharacterized repeat protein (TIGR01451 family)
MRRRTLRATSVRSIKPAVERVEARVLLATFMVTDTNDDTNMGSLRYAITQSNLTPGSNIIEFAIASSGVQTIDLLSALPAITVPVLIDGTTEGGYNGTPLIDLDGAGAGAKVDGLDVQAGNSTIQGLAIGQFTGEGINLSVAGNNKITKDFIGTDPTGTIAQGNTLDGVLVQTNSNNNTITGNVISGNTQNGIYLNGSSLGGNNPATTGNLITGNLIGTDVTGTLTLGNNHDGIYVQNAPMTTVGGTSAATRNIISGNGTGMELYDNSDNSVFEGNYIGTDITGEVALGNNLTGGFFEDNVVLRGISNSTIGGVLPGSGNVISGGSHYGIDSFVIGSDNIAIEGNYIGTDATGTKALGNASGGLVISGPTGVTIGGTVAGARNVISSNGGTGLNFNSAGVLIQGNYIGTDITGDLALGNQGDGISDGASTSSTIGGTVVAARNIISNNSGNGISAGSANSVLIEGNYVGTNTGTQALGNAQDGIIALGGMGATIGGSVAGAGNLVSANGTDGIFSQGVTGALIEGNLVGTDISGTLPLGNQGEGIGSLGGSGSTIGGTIAAARNIVSANKTDGIYVQGTTGLVIQGNYIGTDITGTMPLGNGGSGVEVFASGTTVGGLEAGAENIIANNGTGNIFGDDDSGVAIVLGAINGVSILSNSIYNNEKLGIDLGGGNNGQAAPMLTSAFSANNSSTIAGSLTAANGTYTVQFFATPSLNPSGNAEGETLLGTATVTITAGTASFSETFSTSFTPGELITATATDSTNDTSQFSPPVTGQQTPVLPTLTVVASSASIPVGQQVTDTFTITNPASVAEDDGVIFSDAIPAGTTFSSGTTSTGATVSVSGGVATAVIGTLTAGEVVTVTIVLVPSIMAEPSFTNTGDVTATTPPISAGTVTASVTTDVLPSADLAVTITGPAGKAVVGKSLVYTVIAVNDGPSPATGIMLTDTLPGAVTYVSASSSSGQTPTESNGMIVDSVPTLAVGATEVLTITVIPTSAAPPSVIDTASVTANEFDPNGANNTFSLTTTVTPVADLAITGETITPSTVVIGNEVTISIAVANNGPSTANSVIVTDTLPAGLTFLSGTSAGGTVTLSGASVTAPVGTLLDGGTSIVTIIALTTTAGTFIDSSTISGAVDDPDPANNTGSAFVIVTPLADLSVVLTGTAGPVYTGAMLTYTAVVTNNGPSPATNVLFADPLFAGATFESVQANGVYGSLVNGVAELSLGTIADGASVTVVLTVVPALPGVVTDTAVVAGTEPDPDPANNTSSVSTFLVTPMSLITFASPAYEVLNNSDYAAITLVRAFYFQDDVTVHFSTIAGGNAVPGIDYEPVSETVDFPAGATVETVLVPVLDDLYENHNDLVYLQLDTPTGSGVLDPDPTHASLTIIDVSPELVGPTITGLNLTGFVSSIISIELDTTGHLNPTTATDTNNYTLTALGGAGKQAFPAGTVVPVISATYDVATGSVTLTPETVLPGDELFLVNVNGTRPGAITDLAGNPLNSIYGLTIGSDYNLTVARGTDIVYSDQNNDPVTVKLSGPGTVDIDRYVAGDLEYLQVVGGVTSKTVVTATVHPTSKRSMIGSILGLGQFGSIRLKMTTPAFYVTNVPYPNLETQVDAPSTDTLLPTPVTVKTKPVKAAKAPTVHASAVHPAKDHPVKVHVKAVHVEKVHASEAQKPAARHRR